jgi:hypothetical protein
MHDSSNTHAGIVSAAMVAAGNLVHDAALQVIVAIVVGVCVGQANRVITAWLKNRS